MSAASTDPSRARFAFRSSGCDRSWAARSRRSAARWRPRVVRLRALRLELLRDLVDPRRLLSRLVAVRPAPGRSPGPGCSAARSAGRSGASPRGPRPRAGERDAAGTARPARSRRPARRRAAGGGRTASALGRPRHGRRRPSPSAPSVAAAMRRIGGWRGRGRSPTGRPDAPPRRRASAVSPIVGRQRTARTDEGRDADDRDRDQERRQRLDRDEPGRHEQAEPRRPATTAPTVQARRTIRRIQSRRRWPTRCDRIATSAGSSGPATRRRGSAGTIAAIAPARRPIGCRAGRCRSRISAVLRAPDGAGPPPAAGRGDELDRGDDEDDARGSPTPAGCAARTCPAGRRTAGGRRSRTAPARAGLSIATTVPSGRTLTGAAGTAGTGAIDPAAAVVDAEPGLRRSARRRHRCQPVTEIAPFVTVFEPAAPAAVAVGRAADHVVLRGERVEPQERLGRRALDRPDALRGRRGRRG